MFYVIAINATSEPQKLWGPHTWDECVKIIKATATIRERDLTQDQIDIMELDGFLADEKGWGGLHIIMSESLN